MDLKKKIIIKRIIFSSFGMSILTIISSFLLILIIIAGMTSNAKRVPGAGEATDSSYYSAIYQRYKTAQANTFSNKNIKDDISLVMAVDYIDYKNKYATISSTDMKFNSDLDVVSKGEKISEDNNRNGVLDDGEDINENNILETSLEASSNMRSPIGDYVQKRLDCSNKEIAKYYDKFFKLYQLFNSYISKYDTSNTLQPPIKNPYVITAGWLAEDTVHGEGKLVHHGVDFVYQGDGEPTIEASYPGEVIYVATTCPSPSDLNKLDDVICPGVPYSMMGNVIVIKSEYKDKEFLQFYAHGAPNNMYVKVGDNVEVGQPIGVMGSSGYSTGGHIHYAIMYNGEYIDPTPFF